MINKRSSPRGGGGGGDGRRTSVRDESRHVSLLTLLTGYFSFAMRIMINIGYI